jgi:hypothetical protein
MQVKGCKKSSGRKTVLSESDEEEFVKLIHNMSSDDFPFLAKRKSSQ